MTDSSSQPPPPTAISAKFVILHHTVEGGEHWDLMVELEAGLATWQLVRRPMNGADFPIPARRLADHRAAYLTYEGSISGDRGHVARVDEGQVEILHQGEVQWSFVLLGKTLSGRFGLRMVGNNRWLFELATPESERVTLDGPDGQLGSRG